MSFRHVMRAGLIAASVCVTVALQSSCARAGDTDGEDQILFTPDSGAAASGLCVETNCPAPFATCPGRPGLCTTDLRSDVDNCGGCGKRCPAATPATHGSWLCSDSQCKLACDPYYANCNLLLEDGCEVATMRDPQNCGFCGNKCKDGDICWLGACGCPNGFTQCGDKCVDTTSDDYHCSACDTPCVKPETDTDPRWKCGPNVIPWHTKFRCGSSACELRCEPGFQDCNDDFCGDGCEVDIRTDPQNCGACGHACQIGQFCTAGTCMCPPGTTRCGNECVDTTSDVRHCGRCNGRCPGAAVNGGPSCINSTCGYACYPGFANCDGRLDNGCEVDLMTDQLNCGACKTKCNVRDGQPCVKGQCLTKPCETPTGPR